MTCKKCGASLAANANFCHHCGEKQELPTWQQPMYGQAAQPANDTATAGAGGSSAQPQTGNASATSASGAAGQSGASTQPPAPQPYPVPQPQYNPYYNPYNPYSRVRPGDAPHIGYAILCFFFPIVGLILYLVWRDEFPQRAKSAGKGALVGVITGVVLAVLAFILWFGLIFWIIESSMYY